MTQAPEVVVEPWPIDLGIEALIVVGLTGEPRVLVLPREVDGATGLYGEENVTAAKVLRSAGVPAEFLHDSEHRTFLGHYSADVVAAIAIGVASNATWDTVTAIAAYVAALVGRGADEGAQVNVKIARLETKSGNRLEGLSITGPSGKVAERILEVLTKTDE